MLKDLFIKCFNIKKLDNYFFSYLFLSLIMFYMPHKGTYFTEKEALKESIKLNKYYKNRSKWLPCKNEKELHKYLGKINAKSKDKKRKYTEK